MDDVRAGLDIGQRQRRQETIPAGFTQEFFRGSLFRPPDEHAAIVAAQLSGQFDRVTGFPSASVTNASNSTASTCTRKVGSVRWDDWAKRAVAAKAIGRTTERDRSVIREPLAPDRERQALARHEKYDRGVVIDVWGWVL